MVKTVCLTL